MSGVGAPAFLPPASFVRSPELLARKWSAEEGRAYTRWLATNHYENFHVVSFLLPKRLHQDFYNVYAYCRWADDLADEIGDTAESLRLLAWWRERTGWHVRRAGDPSGVRGARAHREAIRHSEAAILRLDRRLRTGSDGDALSRLGANCSATAATRRIRSGGWCCTCAGIAMPSGSGSATRPVPRCNWPTSGRT